MELNLGMVTYVAMVAYRVAYGKLYRIESIHRVKMNYELS